MAEGQWDDHVSHRYKMGHDSRTLPVSSINPFLTHFAPAAQQFWVLFFCFLCELSMARRWQINFTATLLMEMKEEGTGKKAAVCQKAWWKERVRGDFGRYFSVHQGKQLAVELCFPKLLLRLIKINKLDFV